MCYQVLTNIIYNKTIKKLYGWVLNAVTVFFFLDFDSSMKTTRLENTWMGGCKDKLTYPSGLSNDVYQSAVTHTDQAIESLFPREAFWRRTYKAALSS